MIEYAFNNDDNNDNNSNNDNDDDLPVDSPHKGAIMLSFDVTFVESKNNSRVSETPCPSHIITMMWCIFAAPSYLYFWKQLWIN